MASTATGAASSCSCSQRSGIPKPPFLSNLRRTPPFPLVSFPNSISVQAQMAGAGAVGVVAAAAGKSSSNAIQNDKNIKKEEEMVEVKEEFPWIQEKALDLVEFTGSVTQAIPGPRVGQSSLPWILALPLAYSGITFVIAFVKTVKKFGSPRHKGKRLLAPSFFLFTNNTHKVFVIIPIWNLFISFQVNKNSMLCKPIDELFEKGGGGDASQQHSALKGMEKKLPEFCSRDNSLAVKEIFGVADEDADKLRLHTLSEAGDMDSLEKMVDGSDSEDSYENSSNAP